MVDQRTGKMVSCVENDTLQRDPSVYQSVSNTAAAIGWQPNLSLEDFRLQINSKSTVVTTERRGAVEIDSQLA